MTFYENLGLTVRSLFYLLHAPQSLFEIFRRKLTVVLSERIPLKPLEAKLDRRRRLCRELLRFFRPGEPAIGVARDALAAFASEKLPYRKIESLSLYVPKRHIHRRQCAHQHRSAAPVGVAVVLVEYPLGVEGILSDKRMLKIGDRTSKCVLLVFKRTLADSVNALIGHHLHEHPVRAETINDKRLYLSNFHFSLLFLFTHLSLPITQKSTSSGIC